MDILAIAKSVAFNVYVFYFMYIPRTGIALYYDMLMLHISR